MVEKYKLTYSPAMILLTLVVGISYMGLGFVMPLQALYGRQIGATSTEIGFIVAAPLLTGFVVAPLIGHMIDRFGPRTMLWSGLFLHAFLFLTYVFVHMAIWLIVLRAIEGVAMVCILPSARSLMNALAPKTRQGEALGLLSAAQMAGILIGPLCGTLLAFQIGFSASFISASIFLLSGALLAVFFLTKEVHSATVKTRIVRPQALSSELFTRPLILVYSIKGVLAASQGVILAIWSVYMQDRGASLPLIGLTWALYSAPIMLIAPFAGRYSDRHGRFLPIFLGLMTYIIVYSLYGLHIPLVWVVVVSCCEGIIAAIVMTAVDGFLADRMVIHRRGSIQAVVGAAENAGSCFGAIAAGLLYTLAPGMPFFMMSLFYLGISGAVLLMQSLMKETPK